MLDLKTYVVMSKIQMILRHCSEVGIIYDHIYCCSRRKQNITKRLRFSSSCLSCVKWAQFSETIIVINNYTRSCRTVTTKSSHMNTNSFEICCCICPLKPILIGSTLMNKSYIAPPYSFGVMVRPNLYEAYKAFT